MPEQDEVQESVELNKELTDEELAMVSGGNQVARNTRSPFDDLIQGHGG